MTRIEDRAARFGPAAPGAAVCVVGSGVAGLSAALAAARAGAGVVLVTADALDPRGGAAGPDRARAGEPWPTGLVGAGSACNTARAQGGIAAAIGADDLAEDHLADTLAAGHGLVDPEAADRLVRDGAAAVRGLLAHGFAADRGRDGLPTLGLEAAHGRPRIVHAGGDRTGAVLQAHLAARALDLVRAGRIELRERTRASSLVVRGGAVSGLTLEPVDAERGVPRAGVDAPCPAVAPAPQPETLSADAVVLATGGYAALFPRTSNHAGARGDGIALAARAGAVLADLEFVQFHPTALAVPGHASFLVSEAVRGAGAVLRDGSGARFMAGVDPRAELAPRDVVARHIEWVMRERGEPCVWLDATGVERDGGRGALAVRFPAISAAVAERGLDWAREPIPVAPAAHYTMGGVATDLDGRTSVPGLFAAGETASTGVHGANRLASNSLLEGLVFGERAGSAAALGGGAAGASDAARGDRGHRTRDDWTFRGAAMPELLGTAAPVVVPGAAGAATRPGDTDPPDRTDPPADTDPSDRTDPAGLAFAEGLGILRDAAGLARASATFASVLRGGSRSAETPADRIAAELGLLIAAAADARSESRGAHQRGDHPDADPAQARRAAVRPVLAADPARDRYQQQSGDPAGDPCAADPARGPNPRRARAAPASTPSVFAPSPQGA